MNFHAYNQSIINKQKIEKIDSKVMVFVIPGTVNTGDKSTTLRFPFKGKLLNVYANCTSPSNNDVEILIEKCSQEGYDTVGGEEWESVLVNNLFIDAGHKSSQTSTNQPIFQDTVVEKNDHFRATVIQGGEGLRDLTIEVEVEISTDL